jgi:rare lipoprotein A
MKKTITVAVSFLFTAIFCAAQTQGSGFRQEGIASWYGADFEGRPTASGELFDPNQFTAAHPDLPFGTMVIVTNVVNGKRVMVRINDKGPFVKSRIIDVSRAAAEQLDMMETGTAQVIVELAPRDAGAGGTTPTAQVSADRTAATPETPADTTPVATSETAAQPALAGVEAAQASASPGTVSGTPNSTGGSQPAVTLPANPAAPSYTPQQPTLVQNAPAAQSGARVPAQTSAAQTVSPRTPATQTPRTPAQTSVVQPRQSTASPQTVPSASSPAARPQSGSLPIASYHPIPTTTRPPVATTSPSPVMPSSAMVPAVPSTPPPVATQQQRNQPVYASAEIAGGPFVSGRYYRLQVGSYKVAKNAVEVFDRLSAAGLNPQWEPFGDMYRVVISNVRAEDINTIAVRLGNAGFKEAIAREER